MEYTDILIALRKISRAVHLDSKRIEKMSGLSIPQLLSLTYLGNCTNYECTQLELRKYLQLNSSTVTGIVNRLIQKGYVARLPKKEDKRSTRLCLTATGLKQLDNAPTLLHDRLAKKLDSLSKKEIKQIEKGLNKLIYLLGEDTLDSNGDAARYHEK